MTEVLRRDYTVRSLDPAPCLQADESVVGSVADLDTVNAALDGVEGLVIAHMAASGPQNYGTAEIPFEVNVKGTAHLFDSAVKLGLRRVVLVSSVSVVGRAQTTGQFLSRDLPASPQTTYALTKHLQEQIARYHHEQFGLEVAVLRPAYICRGDTLVDKYGRQLPSVNWQFIDPRDIGAAASLALRVEGLGYEVFYLMAGPDVDKFVDVAHTHERLGWQPEYRYTEFPRD